MQSQPQGKWKAINEFKHVLGKFLGNVDDNLTAQTLSDVVKEIKKVIRRY